MTPRPAATNPTDPSARPHPPDADHPARDARGRADAEPAADERTTAGAAGGAGSTARGDATGSSGGASLSDPAEDTPADRAGGAATDGEPADELLPVLRRRWSPREWDPSHELTRSQVDVLLEAARWAPSAGNSQPWAFHAARRGSAEHSEMVPLLAASSRRWAPATSLIVVNICHRFVEETDWDYSEFAAYDLGQAVAHLTIQAHSMGLACRQFAAFDRDAVTELLQVPPHWQVMTMTAVGRPAPHAEAGTRSRKPDVTRTR